jgi:hypothetical protein
MTRFQFGLFSVQFWSGDHDQAMAERQRQVGKVQTGARALRSQARSKSRHSVVPLVALAAQFPRPFRGLFISRNFFDQASPNNRFVRPNRKTWLSAPRSFEKTFRSRPPATDNGPATLQPFRVSSQKLHRPFV